MATVTPRGQCHPRAPTLEGVPCHHIPDTGLSQCCSAVTILSPVPVPIPRAPWERKSSDDGSICAGCAGSCQPACPAPRSLPPYK